MGNIFCKKSQSSITKNDYFLKTCSCCNKDCFCHHCIKIRSHNEKMFHKIKYFNKKEMETIIKEKQLEDLMIRHCNQQHLPEDKRQMLLCRYSGKYFESLLEPGTFYKRNDELDTFKQIQEKDLCGIIPGKKHILETRFKQKKDMFLNNQNLIPFEHYYIDIENKTYYTENKLTDVEKRQIALSDEDNGYRIFQYDYGNRYNQLIERYYEKKEEEKKETQETKKQPFFLLSNIFHIKNQGCFVLSTQCINIRGFAYFRHIAIEDFRQKVRKLINEGTGSILPENWDVKEQKLLLQNIINEWRSNGKEITNIETVTIYL